MSKEIEKAIAYFEEEKAEDALVIAKKILESDADNIDALLLMAKISYKLQKWGDALNFLNRALVVEPDNSIALNYKKMVMSIISYWNKDSFNP
jgi:Tfp pilus assembly protein PilF